MTKERVCMFRHDAETNPMSEPLCSEAIRLKCTDATCPWTIVYNTHEGMGAIAWGAVAIAIWCVVAFAFILALSILGAVLFGVVVVCVCGFGFVAALWEQSHNGVMDMKRRLDSDTWSVWIVLWHDERRGDHNTGVHGVFADETMARSEANTMNRTSDALYTAVNYVVTPNEKVEAER